MVIWRDLPSNPSYEVSDSGVIRQKTRMVFNRGRYYSKRGGFVKIHRDDDGYCYVVLALNGKNYKQFVHRLVAEAFIGPRPLEKTVDHINRVRDDNRIENLRYATASEQNKNRVFKKNEAKDS
jgi:hypothetical protein